MLSSTITKISFGAGDGKRDTLSSPIPIRVCLEQIPNIEKGS